MTMPKKDTTNALDDALFAANELLSIQVAADWPDSKPISNGLDDLTFGHLRVLRDAALSPNAVVIPNEKDVLKKLLGKIRQKRGFYSISVGASEVKQAHKAGILKGLDAAEKLIEEAILSQYGEQK
jgi:hypothetical protein